MLTTVVGTSREPALLVARVKWSLSRRGYSRMEGHALFLHAPGIPLRAPMDDTCDVYRGACHQRVDSLFSIAMGKVLFGCLPRVWNIPRVVDDTEDPRVLWVKRATSVECKTIRIAVSAVNDSWVLLLKPRMMFSPNWCVCV